VRGWGASPWSGASRANRAGDPPTGGRTVSWLCSWIVLVAEVDERRLVQALITFGSSHPASCAGGERTFEAGPWWQNRGHGGGLSKIPRPRSSRIGGRRRKPRPGRPGARRKPRARWSRSGGGSTRRGKASWFDEAVVFDETAVEAGLAASPGWARPKGRNLPWWGGDRGRQRPRHRLGMRTRIPRPGDAARRSLFRSRLRQDRAASGSSALGVTAPDVSTRWLWQG